MPRTPNNSPVSTYGPELLAALLRGSKEVFEIRLPYREAVKLRARIHSLRAAMKREGHAMAPVAARTRCQIRFGDAANLPDVPFHHSHSGEPIPDDRGVPAKLIISPYDSEFRAAMESAGLRIEEALLGPARAPHTATDAVEPPNDIEAILDGLPYDNTER